MDSRASVDDLFSKLHPCFHPQTRIVIVGAGPSGLSAAYALSRLGYYNVTVIEKYESVGGMCESVEIEGKIYDLGGQVLAANSAPTIFQLAKEVGAELEEMDTHKFATIDSSTGALSDMKVVEDYVSMISLILKIQDEAKNSGQIGIHAVSDFASDLTPAFLMAQGFKSVPDSVAYGYTASGYGYVQDMPYAYFHEFCRTSMAGKIRRFKGGYMSLWKKLSKCLPIQVHLKTEVLSVERDPLGIKVKVKNEGGQINVMEFDKIIISGAFPINNGKVYMSPTLKIEEVAKEAMDFSLQEKDLFSKVQTIDYYTSVIKIRGFEHIPVGFYYFKEFMDPAAVGNPVAMQRFYGDTNIFLFWSYGNSANITGLKVTELAVNAVTRMGGQVEKVLLQRRFKYFPHVTSQDIKDGFYDKLELQLQGNRNTYFVGGLMAFELTERNSCYAISLVCKHFAKNNPVPDFPYVKRLIPLQSNSSKHHRQLDEFPGLLFPDLTCLDAYLRNWAAHTFTQNKTLYTWINEKGDVVALRTYKELHENASSIAHKLLTGQKPSIKPGDRVLLVYVPGLDFVDAFFGCLRAGVIAVPVIPPDLSQKSGQALLHITNIANTCNPVAILSTFSYHNMVRASLAKNILLSRGKAKLSSTWPNLPWIHTDYWLKNSKNAMDDNEITKRSDPLPDDLCFLQFTSGSTGDAKGVMITHGGLIHNVKLMRRRYKSTAKTVLVSWLPQYHDMGLIGGLFTSMVSGGSAILFSPMTFIKNPLLWLHTMSNYRVTHAAGPNFAFEFLVRRLESNKEQNLDLSSMVFLMVAAEPIRPASLKRFIELTKPFGLSQEVIAPGYGLAENCVYVCSAYGDGQPIFIDWQGRVCCGYIISNDENDVDIKIVDPETVEKCENGKEGEIWISSLSAGAGYWGMPELSQKTFRNELHEHPGKKYLKTGDLGRIIDGKLFITGRIKDLIIVSGKNIYSSDVEKTVESSSKILRPGCCAVIGVPEEILLAKGISVPEVSDQIGVVVIAEVREHTPISVEVVEQIRARVADEHGINAASVVLIKARTISKTTSGKIKRYECAKRFIEGTLSVVDKPVTREKPLVQSGGNAFQATKNASISRKDIIEFLKKILVEQTGISYSRIAITESLVSYGVDSIGVVRAAQKLSDFLSVPVGAIDIFTATCIEDLANFSEELLLKSRPQLLTPFAGYTEARIDPVELVHEVSMSHKLAIFLCQFAALAYISFLLIFPAYISFSAFGLINNEIIQRAPCFGYLICLVSAPLVWMLCIFSTCICIAFFGNSFLQPNYALLPEISIWSTAFVKWWALYKLQEVSSKVLAIHLKGTVFLNYWFKMLGAKIASSALLDTVDITDPGLVSIGKEAVLAEGVLLQSHEVKNGILSFQAIRIGHKCSIGPYAVIQKGGTVKDGAIVPALHASAGATADTKTAKIDAPQRSKIQQQLMNGSLETHGFLNQFFGIYMVGFLSSLAAAIAYFIYLLILQKHYSHQYFGFLCICGAFHWFPYTFVAYAIFFDTPLASPVKCAILVAMGYIAHGLIFSSLTCIFNRFRYIKGESKEKLLNCWLLSRVIAACHIRIIKFLSGTEAFCMYLRCLGAKIGRHCSIRAINPVSRPELISIGDGVHLGDFSRIIPGYYCLGGYVAAKIEVQDNSVVGSQCVILPGSVLKKDVILGALSVAPMNTVLQEGGIFVGSQFPVMVKNFKNSVDDRIEEMDIIYKKVLGNLAASLASTTQKVSSRYFHRIGVGAKGILRLYNHIPGLPDHKIFSPGKCYPIIIRHSNCLSSDDDARLDPRGAAIKILSNEADQTYPVLDITLKTGKAFHARTIGDFATWLVCGVAAREEHVKHAPHVRDAMWDSLRRANSYAELHYYSNICRLFRFKDGQEMFVKFKLRPFDEKIDEDSGKVEPTGILPPETGTIPRDEDDIRPKLFLAEDFQRRVNSPDKVCYVLQLQIRQVKNDEGLREIALDCTKPWDETEFPYIDIGEITVDEILKKEETEMLEFNPFSRCHEVDIIRATSCNQSASIDHGRSIVYTICQHLRNKKPLPEHWRTFLDQSDVRVDLSGCPMAAVLEKKDERKVTLTRPWAVTLWLMSVQPLLQLFMPYFLVGLATFAPLNWTIYLHKNMKIDMFWLLPLLWVFSGLLAGLICALTKWILVGRKKEGETEMIWSEGIFMDTIWQAIRTLVGEYFMDMTSGSFLFGIWMKVMGSEVSWSEGVYVDSSGALLNPELVSIREYGSIGREALLFGHIYEGEGGRVKYAKINVGKGGYVGSRGVAMPGVKVDTGGSLGALSLAMKAEVIK